VLGERPLPLWRSDCDAEMVTHLRWSIRSKPHAAETDDPRLVALGGLLPLSALASVELPRRIGAGVPPSAPCVGFLLITALPSTISAIRRRLTRNRRCKKPVRAGALIHIKVS
jgi:hypothetical protein